MDGWHNQEGGQVQEKVWRKESFLIIININLLKLFEDKSVKIEQRYPSRHGWYGKQDNSESWPENSLKTDKLIMTVKYIH